MSNNKLKCFLLAGTFFLIALLAGCVNYSENNKTDSDSDTSSVQPGVELLEKPEPAPEEETLPGEWQEISLQKKTVLQVWKHTKERVLSMGLYTDGELKTPVKTEVKTVAGWKFRFTCPPSESPIIIIVWKKPDGSLQILRPVQ